MFPALKQSDLKKDIGEKIDKGKQKPMGGICF